MSFSTIFSIIGWVLLIGLGLYVFYVISMRSQRRPARISILVVLVLLIGGLAMLTLGAGLVFIDQFEAGVVISPLSPGGVRPDPIGPGIHFVTPFVEYVDRFNTAKQEYTMSGSVNEGAVAGNDAVTGLTSDGQQVNIDATVRFYANRDQVVSLRSKWQSEQNYIQSFVRPTTRTAIYNATSHYKVEDIYGAKRSDLQAEIENQLKDQFAQQGLILEAFQLRNVAFSPEYAQSIEQKQIAQQQSEQAKLLVQKAQQEADQLRASAQGQADAVAERAKGDAEAVVVKAQADAQALKLIADALKGNQDLLTYTYIQKLAPNVGLIMLPASGNNPFILNLSDLQNQAKPLPLPTVSVTSTLPFTTTTP
ncbi:MAG TPA: SPFH domain-containing protein [Anaerolineae bacterium]|nr:SPFH domain-containing protein [Anaerolineae bacterium]